MLTRSRLANVSFFVCSVGELVVLAILAGILEGIITDDPNSNTRALSIVCAYSAGVWSEPLLIIRLRIVGSRQSSAPYLGYISNSIGRAINYRRELHTSRLGKYSIFA
jgi:hypothetical protein